MCTEKLAKAYRFRDTATDVEQLVTSHVGFAPFFRTFMRSPSVLELYRGRNAQHLQVQRDCDHLARAVEALAPSVDRTNRPDNAEYPWVAGDRVVIPAEHPFPQLSLLRTPRGRTFLRLLQLALDSFPPNPALSRH